MNKFMKWILVLTLLPVMKLHAQNTNFSTVQNFKNNIVEKKKILEPIYNAELVRKGLTCWTLGEVEFFASSLLNSDTEVKVKKEKRIRKKIQRFLSDRYDYCYDGFWEYFFTTVGNYHQWKLKRKFLKFEKNMNTWMKDFTPPNWDKQNIVLDIKKTADLVLSILASMPKVDVNQIGGWKPEYCRILGLASANQETVNAMLSAEIKATEFYTEVEKSRLDLRNEVCDNLRQGDKFNREVSSWLENLKVIRSKL